MGAAPTISDGIILTGFSVNSTFMPLFVNGANLVQAYLNQPFRFGNIPGSVARAVAHQLQQPVAALENKSVQEVLDEYDLVGYVSGLLPKQRVQYAPGYLTNSNADGNQYDFFLPGHYDPQIIPFAEETKQPIAPGELLGLGGSGSINKFEAPVLVITGCKFSWACSSNQRVRNADLRKRTICPSVGETVSPPAMRLSLPFPQS